jgi:hypothetical protein
VYGVPLNHKHKTEDFLFLIFQNVSQAYKANMVYMNAPPLEACKWQQQKLNPILRDYSSSRCVKYLMTDFVKENY